MEALERAVERLGRVRSALGEGRANEAVELAGSLLAEFPDAGARLRAMTLQLGGTALQIAGRPREAGEWARRGLRVAIVEAREPRLVAPLLGLVGEAAQAGGQLPRALTCYRHAERRFRRDGETNGTASARANAALVLLRLGDRDAGRRDLLASASLFVEAGNTREAVRVRLILSDLLREGGDLAGAAAVLDEAAGALHEHGGADLGACSALSTEDTGAARGEIGSSSQPVENMTDRLPGCLPGGGPPDPQTEPASAMRYGLLAIELGLRRGLLAEAGGRPADAEAPYAHALATADVARLVAARPVILGRLAELALLRGEGHAARGMLQEVIGHLRAGGARLREASAFLGLAACDELDQRFLDAEGAILEADGIFTRARDPRGALAVRLARARLSLAEGRVELAGRQLRGAQVTAREIGFLAAERAARGSLLALAVHQGDVGGVEVEADALVAEMRARGEGTSVVQAEAVREVARWLTDGRGRLVDEPREWIDALSAAGFRALAREMLVLAAFAARVEGPDGARALAAWGSALFRGADEGRWRDLEAVRRSLGGEPPPYVPPPDAPLRARFDAAEALRLGRPLAADRTEAVHAVVRQALRVAFPAGERRATDE